MVKDILLQWLGLGLMVAAVVSTVLLLAPILTEEYRYRTEPPTTVVYDDPFVISIPAIRVISRVISDVDPWLKEEYQEALQKGVAHAKGSVKPGQPGTVYLFAHSSDSVWNLTRTNIPFYRLDRVLEGDKIHVRYNYRDYTYVVSEKLIVFPHQIEYLGNFEANRLILQTCWPIGTNFKRLLVVAKPLKR